MTMTENNNLIYSSESTFMQTNENEIEKNNLGTNNQNVRIWLERRGGGKLVTVIKGLNNQSVNLELLGRELRKRCAVGGCVKDNTIQIQGNHRDKILAILDEKGIKAKKSGG